MVFRYTFHYNTHQTTIEKKSITDHLFQRPLIMHHNTQQIYNTQCPIDILDLWNIFSNDLS